MKETLRRMREERANGDRGFTLIELLVVVVIIGILVGIAVPVYLSYRKGAELKAAKSDVRNAIAVVEQCYTDNSNAYPTAGTQASAGASLTFTGCSASVNASDQVVLTYTPTGTPVTSYTITGKHSDTTTTYTYSSTTGKIT